MERALRDDPEHAAIRGPVASVMNVDKMRFGTDTATWLARQRQPLAGVFLTHLHLDHVSGLPDVPKGTPLYAGPGETQHRTALNLVVQPIIDRTLEGHAPLREWQFAPDASGTFEGVLDIFGDGSVWALLVPGHTSGSTAYLARTPDGPVLFLGDACHTAWGWEHGVEPGTFNHDGKKSAESLARLRAFVAKHPEIRVQPGHQPMAPAIPTARAE
jgi:glyoxylase-like metal-dependent hydrolase (beta-lactamase superfamily II)